VATPSEEPGQSGSRLALRIGTLMGIPLRVHFTFVLLVAWFALRSRQQGEDVVLSIAFLLLVFACVVLHELGHAVMARRFGVRTREIVLYPIGGLARLERMPDGRAELCIALAGPAVNLVVAALLGPLFLARLWTQGELILRAPGDLLPLLAFANGILFAFNLVPAFPMDGGRVLRAALSLSMPVERATGIATAIGQGIALLFGIFGVFTQQFLLVLIALFVFFGATQEASFHRQVAAVRGRLAREAMITRYETLAPQHALSEAVEKLLATHQRDFPVIDAWDRLVGILPRARLLSAIARAGPDVAVLEVMERDVQTVSPDADLDDVLRLLRERADGTVLVVEDQRLVGMVTLENLGEFIELSRRTAGS
jgi:Zn-dependent protease